MKNNLQKAINANIQIKKKLIYLETKIGLSINMIIQSIESGGKILFCGNGGSAADAQHLVAELVVQLNEKKRPALPALSLALDSSTMTACANDLNYNKIFSRALEGLGKPNDILIILSTSGNSKNIIEVLKKSKKMQIYSIGLLGNNGGKSKALCDLSIVIDSKITQLIQECHIFLGHFILGEVEKKLLKKKIKTKQ
jgi:D-sedoheptulose 7-phosphate isomerase